MNYYIFETNYLGRFAVEAPTYEAAHKSIFDNGLVHICENEDLYYVGKATLEEIDAEGLDVI